MCVPILTYILNIFFPVLDEDASPGVETMLVFSDHVRSFVNPVWTSSGRPVDRKRTGPRRKSTFLTTPIQCYFSSESKLMYFKLV